MMKILSLNLILCFFIFNFVNVNGDFKFKDCSKGNGIVTINRLSLSPDPISFSKNVTVSVHITLNEDLPPNTSVKRSIYKVTSLFGLPIHIPAPCIGEIGSCSTEGCKYLDGFKAQVCPFVPPELKCECPLKAGNYSGEDVTFPMPELGTFVKFLASGQFHVEWKLVQKEGQMDKDIACFVFTGTANL